MRWSDIVNCVLADLYISHDLLWNPRNKDYCDSAKRKEAYIDIICVLHSATGILLSINKLEARICSLRRRYSQEVKKVKNCCNYKPSIKWFHDWNTHIKASRACEITAKVDKPNTIPNYDKFLNNKSKANTENNYIEIIDDSDEEELSSTSNRRKSISHSSSVDTSKVCSISLDEIRSIDDSDKNGAPPKSKKRKITVEISNSDDTQDIYTVTLDESLQETEISDVDYKEAPFKSKGRTISRHTTVDTTKGDHMVSKIRSLKEAEIGEIFVDTYIEKAPSKSRGMVITSQPSSDDITQGAYTISLGETRSFLKITNGEHFDDSNKEDPSKSKKGTITSQSSIIANDAILDKDIHTINLSEIESLQKAEVGQSYIELEKKGAPFKSRRRTNTSQSSNSDATDGTHTVTVERIMSLQEAEFGREFDEITFQDRRAYITQGVRTLDKNEDKETECSKIFCNSDKIEASSEPNGCTITSQNSRVGTTTGIHTITLGEISSLQETEFGQNVVKYNKKELSFKSKGQGIISQTSSVYTSKEIDSINVYKIEPQENEFGQICDAAHKDLSQLQRGTVELQKSTVDTTIGIDTINLDEIPLLQETDSGQTCDNFNKIETSLKSKGRILISHSSSDNTKEVQTINLGEITSLQHQTELGLCIDDSNTEEALSNSKARVIDSQGPTTDTIRSVRTMNVDEIRPFQVAKFGETCDDCNKEEESLQIKIGTIESQNLSVGTTEIKHTINENQILLRLLLEPKGGQTFGDLYNKDSSSKLKGSSIISHSSRDNIVGVHKTESGESIVDYEREKALSNTTNRRRINLQGPSVGTTNGTHTINLDEIEFFRGTEFSQSMRESNEEEAKSESEKRITTLKSSSVAFDNTVDKGINTINLTERNPFPVVELIDHSDKEKVPSKSNILTMTTESSTTDTAKEVYTINSHEIESFQGTEFSQSIRESNEEAKSESEKRIITSKSSCVAIDNTVDKVINTINSTEINPFPAVELIDHRNKENVPSKSSRLTITTDSSTIDTAKEVLTINSHEIKSFQGTDFFQSIRESNEEVKTKPEKRIISSKSSSVAIDSIVDNGINTINLTGINLLPAVELIDHLNMEKVPSKSNGLTITTQSLTVDTAEEVPTINLDETGPSQELELGRNFEDAAKPSESDKRTHSHILSVDNNTGSEDETSIVQDKYDVFAKNIAIQLRCMGLVKALRVSLQLQNIISEAMISDD